MTKSRGKKNSSDRFGIYLVHFTAVTITLLCVTLLQLYFHRLVISHSTRPAEERTLRS